MSRIGGLRGLPGLRFISNADVSVSAHDLYQGGISVPSSETFLVIAGRNLVPVAFGKRGALFSGINTRPIPSSLFKKLITVVETLLGTRAS